MTSEELEFQISHYADGTLPAAEAAALEARLAGDAAAQELLAEYRRLSATMANHLPALPAVDWDRLAAHLSTAVDEADAPAIVGRITPATTSAWSWRGRLAIAASVMIALGGGWLLVKTQRGVQPQPTPEAPVAIAVSGPQVESASGPAVEEITVGPSKALAERADSWRYAEGVVTRPSTAVIAGDMKPTSDGETFIH